LCCPQRTRDRLGTGHSRLVPRPGVGDRPGVLIAHPWRGRPVRLEGQLCPFVRPAGNVHGLGRWVTSDLCISPLLSPETEYAKRPQYTQQARWRSPDRGIAAMSCLLSSPNGLFIERRDAGNVLTFATFPRDHTARRTTKARMARGRAPLGKTRFPARRGRQTTGGRLFPKLIRVPSGRASRRAERGEAGAFMPTPCNRLPGDRSRPFVDGSEGCLHESRGRNHDAQIAGRACQCGKGARETFRIFPRFGEWGVRWLPSGTRQMALGRDMERGRRASSPMRPMARPLAQPPLTRAGRRPKSALYGDRPRPQQHGRSPHNLTIRQICPLLDRRSRVRWSTAFGAGIPRHMGIELMPICAGKGEGRALQETGRDTHSASYPIAGRGRSAPIGSGRRARRSTFYAPTP
jgi:hypothetical protein